MSLPALHARLDAVAADVADALAQLRALGHSVAAIHAAIRAIPRNTITVSPDSPIEADDGERELESGLFTPPKESCGVTSDTLPVIPTPPSLTPLETLPLFLPSPDDAAKDAPTLQVPIITLTNEHDTSQPPTNTPSLSLSFSLSSTPTPSRYATPSESSVHDTCPTDEVEVQRVLVQDVSGVSTPLSCPFSRPLSFPTSPFSFSCPSTSVGLWPHRLSRSIAPGPELEFEFEHELGAEIDPSVLYASQPSLLHPCSEGSLSPLTSMGDTDVDGRGGDASRDESRDGEGGIDTPRPHPPGDTPTPRKGNDASLPSPVVRVAPEATPTTSLTQLGGPSASLDELAMLAKRKNDPSRIYLRLPPTGRVRGSKRKQERVDDGGEDGAVRLGASPGIVTPVDEGVSASARVVPTAVTSVDAAAPRTRRRRGKKAPHKTLAASEIAANGAATSTLTVSCRNGPVDSAHANADAATDGTFDLPAPRKRTKWDVSGERVRVPPPNRKRAPNTMPVRYHVRNGQVVTVTSEPAPRSQTQPADGQGAPTSTRSHHRQEQAHQAIKTPSSPANHPRHPSIKPSPSATKDGGTWPKLPDTFSHWDVQFIQCDNCDKWYHYGCVAIAPGDATLKLDALFICPACPSHGAERKLVGNPDDTCTRPDCPEPQVTADAELYFVEKLVGRKKTEGYVYVWLAKWEGYPMTQASWIPKENVLGDGTRLFNAFLEDALGEGLDLSGEVVLLREAVEAGWEAC